MTLKQWLLFSFLLSTLLGCDMRKRYPTPTEALGDSPANLNEDSIANLTILHQEKTPQSEDIPEGVVMVYMVPQKNATTSTLENCIGITFVSKQSRGWRAESSGGGISCQAELPQGETLQLGGLVGGNITPLSVSFGLLPDDASSNGVIISWADGKDTSAQLSDNLFFDARWETVLPTGVEYELLSGDVVSADY